MVKFLNRLNIALALVSSVSTLAVCVAAAVTGSPALTLVCLACGVMTFATWQFCD